MGAVGNGSAEVVVSRPLPFLSPPSLPSLLLLEKRLYERTDWHDSLANSRQPQRPPDRDREREPALFRPNDDTPLLLPTSLEFVANVPQPREHGGGEVHSRIVALPLRRFCGSIRQQIIIWLKQFKDKKL